MTDQKISGEQLAVMLLRALDNAFKAYEAFMKESPDKKTSADFKAKQDACKMAIAHITLIIDLIRDIEKKEKKQDDVPDLNAMIRSAQAELCELDAISKHKFEGSDDE